MPDDTDFDPDPRDPEIIEHERTYKAFNVVLRWCMTLAAASLSFFTLWLATSAGFLGGAIVGLIILALGYVILVKRTRRQPLDIWAGAR